MGSVYLAEHLPTGENVAVKVLIDAGLNDSSVARLKREAKIMASVRSPYAVKILDTGVTAEGNTPYLVMEYLIGESLAERITREGAIGPQLVVRWITQIAHALNAAHQAGIVHRDIKPANIFLWKDSENQESVKVLDFGVAQLVDSTTLTAPGILLGTPRYMAPEQARSTGAEITHQADIYSIGMLTFTLLAGYPFRRGRSLEQVLAEAMFEPVVAASKRGLDYGEPFDEWFVKSCALSPEARFTSSTEQADKLSIVLSTATRRTVNLEATASVPINTTVPQITPNEQNTVRVVPLNVLNQYEQPAIVEPRVASSKTNKVITLAITAVVVGAILITTFFASSANSTKAQQTTTQSAPINQTTVPAATIETISSATSTPLPSATQSSSKIVSPPKSTQNTKTDPFSGSRF